MALSLQLTVARGRPRRVAEHGPGAQRLRRARGFSLIELMIVVIVISIMAVLAIPTMSLARFDRVAYNDAGAVMQLLRSARTRAIARGGAVMVTLHADSGDRGTFMMYEAVTPNVGGVGLPRTPVASCKTPTNWTLLGNANVLFIDGVNLNGALETQANVRATISMYQNLTNSTATPETVSVDVCWSPLGRSYLALGTVTANIFDGLQPTISPLEIAVQRSGGGTIRSVLVPPNGMARLFSHSAVAQP